MVAELGAYSKAGGEVLFGTDVGYTDHFDTTLEFTLMSQAGMTYQQILASLTTNPARRFKSSGHSGRIANGMNADLVVLRSRSSARRDGVFQRALRNPERETHLSREVI